MALLEVAPEMFERFKVLVHDAPMAKSPAEDDAANPLGRHVRILAAGGVSDAIEHLAVWRDLLTKAHVQPLNAHATLVRGAIEPAVAARWLLAPKESRARTERAVASLLEDYGNRRSFEQDMGIKADKIKPPAKAAAQRYEDLLRERSAAGLHHVKVPDRTELVARHGVPSGPTGRAMYRLLSAFAHGKQWKYLTSAATVVEGAANVTGSTLMQVTAGDDLSVDLTAVGINTVQAALDDFAAYVGG